MAGNDQFIIRYSEGKSTRNFGKAVNKSLPLKFFYRKFEHPHTTPERVSAYDRLSDSEQKHLKSSAGWFYRAPVDGPVRNRGSGMPSDVVTLDFDYATEEFVESLLNGEIMPEWEWFVHSTRSSRPGKPRLRMFVILANPVPNDLYIPVSRIIGSKFDPTMVHLDRVSFRPAQMMFFPTISKDQDYLIYRNRGETVDWSEQLDIFDMTVGDHRDLQQLPKCPNETLRETAEKAEDPTTKKGPVGDFCRAYSVEDAIEAFDLPYELVDAPSAKPRYTYTKGSTTNGAEVQDGGLFLYSHHGSDPCGDMLVNAFDLVRIHLFGDMDQAEDYENAMAKRPSWKSMIAHIQEDPEYRKQVVASRYDEAAINEDFDLAAGEEGFEIEEDDDDAIDAEEAAEIAALCSVNGSQHDLGAKSQIAPSGDPFARKWRHKKPPKGWINDLDLTQDGDIRANAPNVTQIIQNDMRMCNSIAFNQHMKETVLIRPILSKFSYVPRFEVHDTINGDIWEDPHSIALRTMIESPRGPGKTGYGTKVSDRDMKAGIEMASRQLAFHPVREYLEFCEAQFRAQSRLSARSLVESLWTDFMGSPDTQYYRDTARLFLIASVARIFEPGHKFDYSPILHGDQGLRKSTFVSILAQQWYGELKADFSDEKKLVEQMQGCWIMELPELSGIGRSQVEDVKAFISGTSTKARLAYNSRAGVYLRQTTFIGSTNDTEFLIDHTGNRRWWPIEVLVSKIDTDRLREMVNLLWGAAVAEYRAMREKHQGERYLPLFLTDAGSIAKAEELQEKARVETNIDFFAGKINEFLERKIPPEGFDDADIPIGAGAPKLAHRQFTCISQICDELQIDAKAPNTSRQIGQALRKLGWVNVGSRRFPEYGNQKAFGPGPAVLERWHREEKAAKRKRDYDDLI